MTGFRRTLWISAQFVLAAVWLAWPAHAHEHVLQQIIDRGQVNIGYSPEAPPFSRPVRTGVPAGFSIDLCNIIVDNLKLALGHVALRTRYIEVGSDQLVQSMRTGTVDFMCAGVSDTPARRQFVMFSSPIFLSAVKLMVHRPHGIAVLADLKGKPVTVLGRTSPEDALRDFSSKNAMGITVIRAATVDAALSQLRLGQVAAWARDEILLRGVQAEQPDASDFAILPTPLSRETLAIAFQPDAQLQLLVQRTLLQLVRDGRFQALYDKWFVRPNELVPAGLKMPMDAELRGILENLN